VRALNRTLTRTFTRTLLCGLLTTLIVLVALPGAAQAGSVLVRLGSRGAAVVTLQRDLHIRADGDFGPQTLRAVQTFQRRHRLTADGVVGPQTWRALGGAPAASAPRPTHRAAPVSLATRAVWLAAAQRGKPYRWGAAGPNAFDCSGLVQYVYKRLGVSLPRTTWGQYAALRHIGHSAMQPGDLVFLDKLGHVGVYAGYGFIWHAPHTGTRVRLSLIWDKHYLVARV
jgi:cell wall-associated NlpC family hydrolase